MNKEFGMSSESHEIDHVPKATTDPHHGIHDSSIESVRGDLPKKILSLRALLPFLDVERHRSILKFITQIKDAIDQNPDSTFSVKDWSQILGIIESTIEKESMSYRNKTNVMKKNYIYKLGKDYKHILFCISESAVTELWPKHVAKHVISVLHFLMSSDLYVEMTFLYMQMMRSMMNIRSVRHHLSLANAMEIIKICLSTLNDTKDTSLQHVLLNVLSSIVSLNKDTACLWPCILPHLGKFLKNNPNETPCHTLVMEIINYLLIEGSPMIISDSNFMHFLVKRLGAIIDLFISCQVGSKLSLQILYTLRYLLRSEALCELDNFMEMIEPIHIWIRKKFLNKLEMSCSLKDSNYMHLLHNCSSSKSEMSPKNVCRLRFSSLDADKEYQFMDAIFDVEAHIFWHLIQNHNLHHLENKNNTKRQKICVRNEINDTLDASLSNDANKLRERIWSIQVLCIFICKFGESDAVIKFTSENLENVINECISKDIDKNSEMWQFLLLALFFRSLNSKSTLTLEKHAASRIIGNIERLVNISINRIKGNTPHVQYVLILDELARFIHVNQLSSIRDWFVKECLNVIFSNAFQLRVPLLHLLNKLTIIRNDIFEQNTTKKVEWIINNVIEDPTKDIHEDCPQIGKREIIEIAASCIFRGKYHFASLDFDCVIWSVFPISFPPCAHSISESRLLFHSNINKNIKNGDLDQILFRISNENLNITLENENIHSKAFSHDVDILRAVIEVIGTLFKSASQENHPSYYVIQKLETVSFVFCWMNLVKSQNIVIYKSALNSELPNIMKKILNGIINSLELKQDNIKKNNTIQCIFEVIKELLKLTRNNATDLCDKDEIGNWINEDDTCKLYNILSNECLETLNGFCETKEEDTLNFNSNKQGRLAHIPSRNTSIQFEFFCGQIPFIKKKIRRNNLSTKYDSSIVLIVSALRTLGNLILQSSPKNTMNKKIEELQIYLAETLYDFSQMSALILTLWLKESCRYLSQKCIKSIIDICVKKLSNYDYEEDCIYWVFVLRCLSAFSSVVVNWNKEELNSDISRIIMFFKHRLDKSKANWRLHMEYTNTISTYIALQIDFFNELHPIEQNGNWVCDLTSSLLQHENFFVRIMAGRLAVHLSASKKIDASTKNSIYNTLCRNLSLYKLQLTTSLLTLSNYIIYLEQYRVESTISLLNITGNFSGLVKNALNSCAGNLGFSSSSDFLKSLSSCIIKNWDPKSLISFPFNIEGYDNFDHFFSREGKYLVLASMPTEIFDTNMSMFAKSVSDANMEKAIKRAIPLYIASNAIKIVRSFSANFSEEILDQTLFRDITIKLNYKYDKNEIPYIISETIFNIMCLTYGESSLPLEKGRLWNLLEANYKRVISYKSTFENQRKYPLDQKIQDKYIYTYNEAFLAIVLLEKILNGRNNSPGLKRILSHDDCIYNSDITYRIMVSFHRNLKNNCFVSSKRVFLLYAYPVFLGIFEKVIFTPLFFGIIIQQLLDYLEDPDICDEGYALFHKIFSEASVKIPNEIIKNHFVYICLQLSEMSSRLIFNSHKKLFFGAVNLLKLLFSKMYVINREITIIAALQINTNIKELLEISEMYVKKLDISFLYFLFNNLSQLPSSCVMLTKYLKDIIKKGIPKDKKLKHLADKAIKTVLKLYNDSEDRYNILDIGNFIGSIYLLMDTQTTDFRKEVVAKEEIKEMLDSKIIHEEGSIVETYDADVLYMKMIDEISKHVLRPKSQISYHMATILKNLLNTDEAKKWHSSFPPHVKMADKILKSFTLTNNDLDENFCWEKNFQRFPKSGEILPQILLPTNKNNCTWSLERWASSFANIILHMLPKNKLQECTMEIINVEGSLSVKFLPYIVHMALEKFSCYIIEDEFGLKDDTLSKNLSSALSQIFSQIVHNYREIDKDIIVCVINIVEFLMKKTIPKSNDPFDSYLWLEVDFFELSKAAYHTGMYVSALRFIELSFGESKIETKRSSGSSNLMYNTCQSSTSSFRDSGPSPIVNNVGYLERMEMLILIWSHLSDSRIELLNITNEFSLRETSKDIKSNKNSECILPLILNPSDKGTSWTSDDIFNLLPEIEFDEAQIIHRLSTYYEDESKNHKMIEMKFSELWRQYDYKNDISLGIDGYYNNSHPEFNQILYKTLKSISSGNKGAFESLIAENITLELDSLSKEYIMLEFLKEPVNIFILGEISEAISLCHIGLDNSLIPEDKFCDLFELWDQRMSYLNDNGTLERTLIIESRSAVLMALIENFTRQGSNNNLELLCNKVGMLWLDLANLLRRTGNYNLAMSYVSRIKHLCTPYRNLSSKFDKILIDTSLESLEIMCKRGELIPSKQKFQNIYRGLSKSGYNKKNILLQGSIAKYICTLGKWAGELMSEDPNSIRTAYFETAIELISGNDIKIDKDVHFFVHEEFAKFTHKQYKYLCANDHRHDIEEYTEYKKREADACEKLSLSTTDSAKSNAYNKLRERLGIQIDLNTYEIKKYTKEISIFLHISVEQYCYSVMYNDNELDISAFKLCDLWLSNQNDPKVNRIIKKHLSYIPSYKFIPLFYHLLVRMYSGNEEFNEIVHELLLKVITDHPHHTIYRLMAYFMERDIRSLPKDNSLFEKESLINKIKASSENMLHICCSMEKFFKTLISFSGASICQNALRKSRIFKIAEVCDLKGEMYKNLSVPIHNHPISRDRKYDDMPMIVDLGSKFFVPGGINKPKVIKCLGSDGIGYYMLIKGNDDLRQDYIIMEIFNVVNRFFSQNASPQERLKLRTYKIVPLSRRAGIVEWVGNTIPIGKYLTKAHRIHNPNDWSPNNAYSKMFAEYKRRGCTPESQFNVYNAITENFKPVFRHFFLDNFKTSANWFRCRCNYSKSLAVNSIAGYIVGIGDRHAYNILIEKNSGEIVHIDFGVAFDQGKVLTVPELVPFRLTRDMVDGLGATKCEGIFRESCESTLITLRKCSEILLLILNVFKYDPLYNWRLSPLEQCKRQGLGIGSSGGKERIEFQELPIENKSRTDSKTNKEAERAILGVQRKLQSPLNVKCQVNELIESASNPRSLCQMFPGWQAWM